MSLTAGVKEKDRRIAELEDLVRDLIAYAGPDPRNLLSACRCGGGQTQINMYPSRAENPVLLERLPHAVDCAIERATKALIRRLY